MKSRFRLGKQGFGASFGLFFDAGPVLFEPALDLPFVALDGPARGFLPAPSQGLQKLADVVEMIRNATLLFAHFCNSFLRPQIARITVRLGAFQKLFEKLLFLGRDRPERRSNRRFYGAQDRAGLWNRFTGTGFSRAGSSLF